MGVKTAKSKNVRKVEPVYPFGIISAEELK
jgi:hypothetical protein